MFYYSTLCVLPWQGQKKMKWKFAISTTSCCLGSLSADKRFNVSILKPRPQRNALDTGSLPARGATDPEVWPPSAARQFSALRGSIGITSDYYYLQGAVTWAWLCFRGVEFHEVDLVGGRRKQQLDGLWSWGCAANSCCLVEKFILPLTSAAVQGQRLSFLWFK